MALALRLPASPEPGQCPPAACLPACLPADLAWPVAKAHPRTPPPHPTPTPPTHPPHPQVDIWALGISTIEMAEQFPPRWRVNPNRVIFQVGGWAGHLGCVLQSRCPAAAAARRRQPDLLQSCRAVSRAWSFSLFLLGVLRAGPRCVPPRQAGRPRCVLPRRRQHHPTHPPHPPPPPRSRPALAPPVAGGQGPPASAGRQGALEPHLSGFRGTVPAKGRTCSRGAAEVAGWVRQPASQHPRRAGSSGCQLHKNSPLLPPFPSGPAHPPHGALPAAAQVHRQGGRGRRRGQGAAAAGAASEGAARSLRLDACPPACYVLRLCHRCRCRAHSRCDPPCPACFSAGAHAYG